MIHRTLAFVIVLTLCPTLAAAQPASVEQEIRALDERSRLAVLEGDIPAVEALWAPEFMVNNPNNFVMMGREGVFALMRAGVIRYDLYDKVVEQVMVDGDMALSMGAETVRAIDGPRAGILVNRRYTHIWRKRDDRWVLVARHANIAPDDGRVRVPGAPR